MPASQSGAASPRTSDAVDAVLASTHEPAATVTVRQHEDVGRPVRGSTTWWTGVPPSDQWRLPMPEVARPPEDTATAVGASGSPQTSATPIDEPADRCGPDGDVAAEGDQRAAPQALRDGRGGAVGRPRLGRGPEVEDRAGRHREDAEVGVEDDRSPPRNRRRGGQVSGHPGRHLGEVAVVAEALEGGTDGRVDEAVGQLGGAQGGGQEVAQHVRHGDGAAARTVDPAELRVGSEAAGRILHPVELLVEEARRGDHDRRVGHQHLDAGGPAGRAVDRQAGAVVESSRRAQLEPLVTGAWR